MPDTPPVSAPDVRLTRASRADRDVLTNLLQLYYDDFSEFSDDDDAHLDADGRFPSYVELDDFLDQPEHFAWLIHVGPCLAGFALVSQLDRSGAELTWGMQEFFVVRHWRRRGVGRSAAMAVFDRLPGRWEVGEIHANTGAIEFWRRVIEAYTGGRFSEVGAADPDAPGPLQIFRTPTPAT